MQCGVQGHFGPLLGWASEGVHVRRVWEAPSYSYCRVHATALAHLPSTNTVNWPDGWVVLLASGAPGVGKGTLP